MNDTSKGPREKLDELIREFGRGNYHHVNDTEKRKSMSFDDCQATYKYLSNYQSLKEQCEKLAKALEEISKTKYGLQGYVEENDDKGAFNYMSNLCFEYEKLARQALENYRKWKGEG